MSEATDPELKGQWEPVAKRDFVQQKLDADQKTYEKRYPHDHPESIIWSVRKRAQE